MKSTFRRFLGRTLPNLARTMVLPRRCGIGPSRWRRRGAAHRGERLIVMSSRPRAQRRALRQRAHRRSQASRSVGDSAFVIYAPGGGAEHTIGQGRWCRLEQSHSVEVGPFGRGCDVHPRRLEARSASWPPWAARRSPAACRSDQATPELMERSAPPRNQRPNGRH